MELGRVIHNLKLKLIINYEYWYWLFIQRGSILGKSTTKTILGANSKEIYWRKNQPTAQPHQTHARWRKKNNKLWSWISNKGSTKKRISLILKTNSPNMYLFNPESPIPEKQARTDPVGSPPGLHLQKPTQAAPERPPIQDAVRETQGRPGNVPSAKEEQRINWSVSLGLNLIKIRYGQEIKRRRKTFPRSHTFLLEAKTYVFSESEALGSAGYDEQQFVKQ